MFLWHEPVQSDDVMKLLLGVARKDVMIAVLGKNLQQPCEIGFNQKV